MPSSWFSTVSKKKKHFINSRGNLQMFLALYDVCNRKNSYVWNVCLHPADAKGLRVQDGAYSAIIGCKKGSKLQPISNVNFSLWFVNMNVIVQAEKQNCIHIQIERYENECEILAGLIDSSCRMFDSFGLRQGWYQRRQTQQLQWRA